jgi:hypothetical protein
VESLGRGGFFGEIALLERRPPHRHGDSDTDLVAQVMSHQEFTALLMDVPEVTRGILKGVATGLPAADANLVR